MSERTFKLQKTSQEWKSCTTITREELGSIPDLAARYDAFVTKHPNCVSIKIWVSVSVSLDLRRWVAGADLSIRVIGSSSSAWIFTRHANKEGFKGAGAFQTAFDALYFKVWEESAYLKDWMPLEWLSPEADEKRREKIRQACLGLIGSVPDVFVPPRAIVMSQAQIEALAAKEEDNG